MEQEQGIACWPCAKTKSKCEPGEGNATGSRKPAPTKRVMPSQSQPDQTKRKAGPSQQVLAPASKPCRRLVKSVVYVFSSDEESEGEEKVSPS